MKSLLSQRKRQTIILYIEMYNISGYERCCEGKLTMEMPTYSSILAEKIQRTEEPGGLQSMG